MHVGGKFDLHRDYEMIILTDGPLRRLNQLIGCNPLERKDHVMMMTIQRSAPKQVIQYDQRDISMCNYKRIHLAYIREKKHQHSRDGNNLRIKAKSCLIVLNSLDKSIRESSTSSVKSRINPEYPAERIK